MGDSISYAGSHVLSSYDGLAVRMEMGMEME
jgi:hypothetical protein